MPMTEYDETGQDVTWDKVPVTEDDAQESGNVLESLDCVLVRGTGSNAAETKVIQILLLLRPPFIRTQKSPSLSRADFGIWPE